MYQIRIIFLWAIIVICPISMANQSATASRLKKETSKEKSSLSSQKVNTSGFSFLLEPTPSWVQNIPADTSVTSKPNAPIQILLSDQQVNLETKRHNNYIHMLKRVSTGAGLSAASQIQIEFDPVYQDLIIHKIELIRNDQRIEKLEARRIQLLQRETQLEARLYDGRVTASIVLDDVRVGDKIEYSYTIRGSNPVFDAKFALIDNTGSSAGPTAQYSLRVYFPSTRVINYRAPKNVLVETKQNGLMQELNFNQKNIPQSTYEESSSITSYIEQFIQLSEFSDWHEVARWGEKLFGIAYVDDERIVSQVALWKKLASQKEQLDSALDFVQKEIRYFGTEIGVNSHKPDLPNKILKQRYGDCKDKTSLLIALLKALDISATPVLVSTVFREETGELLPSPLVFNHVIAGVEIDGKRLWLDGTRDQQTGPAEKREVRDYGKVLLAQEQSNNLIMLPSSLKELHKSVEDYFQLKTLKNDPVLISTTTYYGDLAESIRHYLAQTPSTEVQVNHAKPYLRPYPKLRFNGELKVQEVAGDNAIQLIQEFSTKELWHIKKYDVIKADLVFWSIEDELYLPKEMTRKTPFRIQMPGIYRHTIVSEFSEELLDSYKEEKYVDGQANFSLVGAWSATSKKATWSTELHYLTNNVQVNQWRSYADKVKQVRSRFYYQLLAHVLDQAQVKSLDKDFSDIENKRSSLSLPLHESSKILILYANAMLASGRLSPELKKLTLMLRSNAELSLNFYDHSANDMNAVLDMVSDPDSDVLAQAALVAFARKNDSTARELVNEALVIAPHEKNLHELTMMLDYFSDDYQAVIKNGSEQLTSRDGAYAYFGLLRYLANRKLGKQEKNQLQEQLDDGFSDDDTSKLLKFYLGKVDFDQIIPKYTVGKVDSDQITPKFIEAKINLVSYCQIYFFAAEKMMVDGNLEKAKEYWKNVIGTGLANRYEFMGASRRLAMLDKR